MWHDMAVVSHLMFATVCLTLSLMIFLHIILALLHRQGLHHRICPSGRLCKKGLGKSWLGDLKS